MSITVRDATRAFPLQDIPHSQVTLGDLFQYMVSLKRINCPLWTDESPSDVGMQLLHLFTVLAIFVINQTQLAKNDTYLGTTTDREAMRQLCRLINYDLAEAAPASATVTFILETDHPGFQIQIGTQVGTQEANDQDAVVFEVGTTATVSAGQMTIDIICSQGITVLEEVLGGSDGTSHQRFALSQPSVIWASELVEVNDGTWQTWTLVTSFIDSGPTDKHYRIEIGTGGIYEIIFGDGVNGSVPLYGSQNVRVTYRIGGGIVGNVAAGEITELLTALQYVESISNTAAASGGTDAETLEHARQFAPAGIRTQERAVTTEDIENICRAYTSPTYGGIAQAHAHVVGSYLAQVAIVPKTGGLPSAGFRTEVNGLLTSKTMIGSTVEATEPHYLTISISATITVLQSYFLPTVAEAVRSRLQAYLSPAYQDPETGLYPHEFGRNLYISDIYSVIQDTPGVDHCQVSTPTIDTIVEGYQIAVPGTITITAEGDPTAPPFHDSRLSRRLTGESSRYARGQSQ